VAGTGIECGLRPLSYYPLSLWSWQDAIKAVFLDRVNIVANYDHAVHSPSFEMQLPSVVSLKSFVKPSTHPAFTRFNVFLRDKFSCQYCHANDDLTFDHIMRAQGRPDHLGKRRRRPARLQPAQGQPDAAAGPHVSAPDALRADGAPAAIATARLFPPNYLHDSWLDYLYWDTELDP